MPAIASLEDLIAAQKEGLSIYAMSYLSSKAETTATEDALCSMRYLVGALAGGEELGTTKRVRVISEFHRTCAFVSLRWEMGCVSVSPSHSTNFFVDKRYQLIPQ